MASIVMAIRRFRDGRAAAVGLAILVLVSAVCAAAAPRLLDRAANDALRGEVAAASGFDRNIQLIQVRRYGDVSDPLGGVVDEGADLMRVMPASVQDLIASRAYVIEGLRWAVQNKTKESTFVRMRIQEGIEDRITFVDGHAPTATTRTIKVPSPEPGEPDVEIPVLQTAVSVDALTMTGLAVGDTVMLKPDSTDRVIAQDVPPATAAVEIVGAFRAKNPTDAYWLDDPTPFQPGIRRTRGGDAQLIDITAILAPEEYPLLLDTPFGGVALRYTWRYFVDPTRFQAATAGSLLADVRRLDGLYPSTGGNAIEGGTTLRSGLLPLLEGEQARWASAVTILTVIGLGPLTVGCAAIALIGLFVMQRRRAALALGRARGGSAGQLIGALLVEGLILSVPSALVAGLIATLLIPTGPTALTVAGAAAVAILTTLLLVAAGAPVAVSAPRGPGRAAAIFQRPGARRIAAEGFVVVLAIGGAYLLRQRGVAGASSSSALGGADPFIAAVPALAGVAAGIIAIRLLPVPMLILSSLAAIRRDLVPVLALRRVTRGGTSGSVLVVLLATATIGTFSAATLVHIDRAADAVAWQEVGAPYRISGQGVLPLSFDPATFPGVEASAGETAITGVLAKRFLPLTLYALEAANYEKVVGGTSGDPKLPDAMLAPTIAAAQPIPAIVSPQFSEGAQGLKVGDTFDLVIEGYPLTFGVVEIRDSFPSIEAGTTFAIVSRDQLRSLRNGGGLRSTSTYFLRAPDDAGSALRQRVASETSGFTVESRAERTAAIRLSPVVQSLVAGVAAAALLAFAYAALAVSAALALAGAARAIEVAHLRTLGLTRREALGLLIVEHGPTIVVAFAAGVGLGLVLFALLRPGLGLAALTGADIDVSIGIEPAHLLLLLIAISLIVAVGIGLGAALQRGAAPAAAVRRGFE